jgi:hypothetical protein
LQVLERRRQAVQRRQWLAARGAAVGCVGERETLVVVELRDDRVQARVEAFDAAEMRRHDLARRHLPRANHAGEVHGAREAELVRRSGGGWLRDGAYERGRPCGFDEVATVAAVIGHAVLPCKGLFV